MVTFFQRVPRELRDQIYRELLVNNVHSVRLLGSWRGEPPVGNRLHPAILRTCKQAYTEAFAMLYEENVFRFSSERLDKVVQDYSLSKGCLERIKHAEIAYPRERLEMYGDATSINQILKMTGWVGAIGCSLETLHITFMFGGGMAWLIVVNEDIYQAFACLHVSKKIEITVKSDSQGDRETFGTFASRLARKKRWAVTSSPTKQAISGDGQNGENPDAKQKYDGKESTVDGFLDLLIHKQAEKYNVEAIPEDTSSDEETTSIGKHLRANTSIPHIWSWILTPKATASEGTKAEVAKLLK